MLRSPQEHLAISVRDRTESALAREMPLVVRFATVADEVPNWPSKERDSFLDGFWRSEPVLSGAVFSMVAKLAALDFKIRGPRKGVAHSVNVLRGAEFGDGWLPLIEKVCLDIITQDNGGFIELARKEDRPTARVEGIAHLDAQLCERTGDPVVPVVYTSSAGGDPIPLQWYQVVALVDLPSAREAKRGIGFCAVSRILRAAQVIRDVATYKRQKLQGKRIPGILFVQGIRTGAVEAALTRNVEAERAAGRTLYSGPPIISGPDPGMPVDAKLIELAGLPDGYDEDSLFKWYITTLSMAFGTDYSEFAPLPGGNLGSASQVEQMAQRARGKGPGLLLQRLEHAVNYNMLPPTQEFEFSSSDPSAETQRVALRHDRARARALQINSGEITPEQGLFLAVEEGDAPEHFLHAGQDPSMADGVEVVVRSRQDEQDLVEVTCSGIGLIKSTRAAWGRGL